MKRKDLALQLFREGKNCAQAVLLSFSEELDLDKKVAEQIAYGFGAGMGRLQKTCGALTGSFMVIGMYNSISISEIEKRKEITNELIQRLDQDFSAEFGYSDCSLLTDVNLNTPEGQETFAQKEIDSRLCEKCVAACSSWLDKNLFS